ncbi:arf-GAP with Rho-GAP domain, ANK repeat and PH domain-containing protein 1 [Spea bombifrons]|uniref:arf-GAP with Rho-GAP domain, ANK repeat and PH domain-containing protein 1 n=1 Tax=Spea bombifrons TaxID=233779 RepID=UPI00234983E0|nr:arf-GAP with Rho-GAP domain, ANK repeat and PH domain-containing protein 1 [Spea bombifrons]
MAEDLSLPISECLQSLKLDQYADLFEKNDFHTVSDLRALSDEGLTQLGVHLPGHRKRIMAFLQKSISQDSSWESSLERPVAMKRSVFRETVSSDQETPPHGQYPLIPPRPSVQARPACAPPPIPPRKGSAPPVKFSVNPPLSAPESWPEPSSPAPADPIVCPVQAPSPTEGLLEKEETCDGAPQLVVPPLPAKRHKIENKSSSKTQRPLPVRPPVLPPRIFHHPEPKESPPPTLEEPKAPEDHQNVFLSAAIVPKPLPRLPPQDLSTKQSASTPREAPPGSQTAEVMEPNLGIIYEQTGEIDGVILTGFRKTKLNSLMSDDDMIENGSDEYEDVGHVRMQSDGDLSTWRSSSSLSSGISSSHSGNMDDTEFSANMPVVKAGWLDKNPPQGSYIFQKRWVKLDVDYLRYYDTDKDMYSKRFIKTSSISQVTSGKDQKFEVSTSNRNFVFRAESDADRNDWVKAFEQVLGERRKRFSTINQMSGGPENVDKIGFLEMRGCKPKLFVVVASDKVYLYKNYEDYMSGVGVTSIDMNLGNVKDCDKKSFDLTTPYRTFSFSAESEAEKSDWVEAMLQSVAEALSNLEVAKKIWSVEANQRCADCNAPNPDWASINLCVVICKKCAGEHRGLGPSISKVRSLKMDNKVWTDELIELFRKIGNGVSNQFWAANVPPSEAIDSLSGTQDRKTFIAAKYREGKYRRYHQLFGNQAELNKALCAAVTTSDLTETQALIFCGADVSCSSEDLLYPHPIDLAEQAGQRLQVEFLQQNKTSEIPRLDLGGNMEKNYYVTHQSITHNGYLYKTSSMTKLVTERKAKEEFSRRWCVLNDNILSYYENNHSSTPNGEIKAEEIVCVAAVPPDTHGYESTFEIYTKSERLYLFAADTPEECREWVKSITKCFLPLKAEELLSYDFDRIGKLQYKGGRSLERTRPGWFSLCKTNLYTYLEDDAVEVINLKKLSELSNKDKEILVLVQKGRITFILGERKLDFSAWVNAIQTASSTSGDTLSEQQLTDSDVPFIVQKCILHISQFGVGSEGIYRKSGQNSKTTTLLEALKKDARSVVLKEDEHPVDNVSDALKRFFRDIGEGIFAEHCIDWLNVTDIEDASMRIGQYQKLLENLPPVNRVTLKALIDHLHCIQHFSNVNQMNVHNLAIVFGPTLFQTVGQNYKPGRVVEDLITFYLPIFNVDNQELKKELEIISTIIGLRNKNQKHRPGSDFICTVYLGEKKPETEQIVHIPVTMTAQELTETLLERRNIRSKDDEYWSCFEVDESEELERPLHFSENVLHIFHSQTTSRSHMVVKKNLHMEAMLHYINSRVGDSKHGTMKFREDKSFLGGRFTSPTSYSSCYFMLNNTTLRMYKDVRVRPESPKLQNASSDSASESHKAEKEWEVKNLTVYLGVKKKIRTQNESLGFTVIYKNEKQERSQWYACCKSEVELREWFAALTFVQYGSLWPEQTSRIRTRQSQLDNTFGNLSLIPIRGSENDIRKSVAAFNKDPLALLGNV